MLEWEEIQVHRGEYFWLIDLYYNVVYGQICGKSEDVGKIGKYIQIKSKGGNLSSPMDSVFRTAKEAYQEAAIRCRRRMGKLEESKETVIERIDNEIKYEEGKYISLLKKLREYETNS